MTARIQHAFLLIAIFQTLHSLEEYFFELWDHMAPTRFLSGLVSDDLPLGFAIINLAIVAVAFWCYLVPVRNARSSARTIVWFWAILETLNGIGHVWFGFSSGGYFPGLYTAPFLLLVGVFLLLQLTRIQNAT
jgi:hypothetical protein